MQLERYLPPSFDTVLDSTAAKRVFTPKAFGVQKEPEPPAPPPPPTFSEAELKAAEAKGHRQGFIEGEAEGKKIAESEMAQVERQIEALMTPLAEQLLEQMKHYNTFVQEARTFAPQLALAVAKKIACESLEKDALPLVERLAVDCISSMLGEPKIVVTVNTSIAERFETKITHHFENNNEPGEIIIQGDDSLKPTDCTIEWAHGLARISQTERLKHIDQLVAEISAQQTFNHTDIITNQGDAA